MRSALAVLVVLFSVAAGASQTAPAKPGPRNLAGTWNLDAWLSDPSEQNEHALQTDLKTPMNPIDVFATPTPGPQPGAGPVVGPGMGPMGMGPMGGGPAPVPPSRRAPAGKPLLDLQDQNRVRSVLELAQLPAASLTITQGDDTITFVDPLRGTRTFHINGVKEKQTFDSGIVESTAKWEGPELHIDFDAGHGVILRFAYLLAPPSNVLLVRFNVFTSGNQGAPFAIRTVYDRQS